jgi:hypothetical protein
MLVPSVKLLNKRCVVDHIDVHTSKFTLEKLNLPANNTNSSGWSTRLASSILDIFMKAMNTQHEMSFVFNIIASVSITLLF